MNSALSVRSISKSFGGLRAVRECSLEIAEGAVTGLIGPNGAGKTTLFNIICGLFRPDSGNVHLRGRDVTGQPAHRLFHRGVVRTFQIPHEFAGMTVLENLMLVPAGQSGENVFRAWFQRPRVRREEHAIVKRAHEVLDVLQLGRLSGELAGNLSGGQKKLLELGRAMMSEARVVLLDEPAAGVNRTLMKTLNAAIRRLNREYNYTFCIVEHDMNFVRRMCNPVVVMAEGATLVQGTMDEIMADQRVLDAYLGGRRA